MGVAHTGHIWVVVWRARLTWRAWLEGGRGGVGVACGMWLGGGRGSRGVRRPVLRVTFTCVSTCPSRPRAEGPLCCTSSTLRCSVSCLRGSLQGVSAQHACVFLKHLISHSSFRAGWLLLFFFFFNNNFI